MTGRQPFRWTFDTSWYWIQVDLRQWIFGAVVEIAPDLNAEIGIGPFVAGLFYIRKDRLKRR